MSSPILSELTTYGGCQMEARASALAPPMHAAISRAHHSLLMTPCCTPNRCWEAKQRHSQHLRTSRCILKTYQVISIILVLFSWHIQRSCRAPQPSLLCTTNLHECQHRMSDLAMYFLKFQWLQKLDLPILDYHHPNNIHLTTDIKVHGSKLLVISYRNTCEASDTMISSLGKTFR